jgi:hypothetical protein
MNEIKCALVRRVATVAMALGVTGVSPLGVTGCGAPVGGPPPSPAAVGTNDTVYRTVVRFDAKGNPQAKTFEVTAAQAEAERDARANRPQPAVTTQNGETVASTGEAITADSSCVGADVWVYDTTGCQAATQNQNEICFYGAGTADLSQYYRRICGTYTCWYPTWEDAVRSYWPGTESGYFWGRSGDLFNLEYFQTEWQQGCTNAGIWAQDAYALTLN